MEKEDCLSQQVDNRPYELPVKIPSVLFHFEVIEFHFEDFAFSVQVHQFPVKKIRKRINYNFVGVTYIITSLYFVYYMIILLRCLFDKVSKYLQFNAGSIFSKFCLKLKIQTQEAAETPPGALKKFVIKKQR